MDEVGRVRVQIGAETQGQIPPVAFSKQEQESLPGPFQMSKNTEAKNWVDDKYILEAFKEKSGSET